MRNRILEKAIKKLNSTSFLKSLKPLKMVLKTTSSVKLTLQNIVSVFLLFIPLEIKNKLIALSYDDEE